MMATCDVCGLRWSVEPREVCPRCEVKSLRSRAEAAEKDRDEARELITFGRHVSPSLLDSVSDRDARILSAWAAVRAREAEQAKFARNAAESERDAARAEAEALREAFRSLATDEQIERAIREYAAYLIDRIDTALSSTGTAAADVRCSACGLDPGAPENPGKEVYTCDRCGSLVCTDCSENADGNRVVCVTCPVAPAPSTGTADAPGAKR